MNCLPRTWTKAIHPPPVFSVYNRTSWSAIHFHTKKTKVLKEVTDNQVSYSIRTANCWLVISKRRQKQPTEHAITACSGAASCVAFERTVARQPHDHKLPPNTIYVKEMSSKFLMEILKLSVVIECTIPGNSVMSLR